MLQFHIYFYFILQLRVFIIFPGAQKYKNWGNISISPCFSLILALGFIFWISNLKCLFILLAMAPDFITFTRDRKLSKIRGISFGGFIFSRVFGYKMKWKRPR